MLIIASLIVYAALLLTAWGIGVHISRRLGIVYDSLLACFALAVGLGLASLIGVGFALGTIGWLTTSGIVVSLGVMAVVGVSGLRGRRDIVTPASRVEGQPGSRWISYLAWLFLGALFVLNLLGALAPDVIWDANSYHLNVAQHWLTHGSLVYLPDNFYGSWPLNLSVLYAIEMGLIGNSILPQLTHFGLGVLSALLIYSYVRPRYGSLAATLATLIFYAVPVVTWLSGTAISDLGVAYFTLFALIGWLQWLEQSKRPWLVVSAIGTGLAMGAKLTGLFTLALLVIAVLYVSWRKRQPMREVIVTTGLVSAVGLALAMPWYLKSLIQTGNPIFPFGYSLFGGRYWTPSVDRQFLAMQFNFMGVGRSVLDYVLLPLRLLVPAHVPYEGPISAIFLIGTVWGAAQRRDRVVNYLMAFAGLNFVLWALWTTQQVRMLLPVLGALSIVAGIGLANVAQRYRGRGLTLLGLITTLLMAEGAIGFWRERSGLLSEQLSVVAGGESRETYLKKYLEPADALFFANEHLPATSVLLAVNEVRTFLSQRPLIWGVPALQAYVDYEQLKTDEALGQRLNQIGVDHILVRGSTIPPVLQPIEDRLQIIYDGNGYRLYELVAPGQAVYKDCYVRSGQKMVCMVNSRADVLVGEIMNKDRRFTQTFTSGCAGLSSIELNLATYGRTNTSSLGFRLTDLDTQQRLVDQVIPAAEIVDNQWRSFTFDPLLDSKGKHYRVTLWSPDARPGNTVSVWRSATETYSDGEAAVDRQPTEGDWAFRYSCTQ